MKRPTELLEELLALLGRHPDARQAQILAGGWFCLVYQAGGRWVASASSDDWHMEGRGPTAREAISDALAKARPE